MFAVCHINRNWLDDCLYYLSAIYFFKVIFITFPFSFWSFTFTSLQKGPFKFYSELYSTVDYSCLCFFETSEILNKCLVIILWIVASLFSTIMLLFSIVVNTMVFEICNLTFLVIGGFTLNFEIQSKYGVIAPIVQFCLQAYNKMDLNLRIYIVNYCVQRQLSVNRSKLSNESLTDPIYVQTTKTLEQWMSINIDTFNNNWNNNTKIEQSKKSNINTNIDKNQETTEIDLKVEVDKNVTNSNKNENANDNIVFNVKDGLSMHHFRDQYISSDTVMSEILSNLRGSIRAFYYEVFSDCSCFSIRNVSSRKEYVTSEGVDYACQKCGTIFLFPLFAFSSIYTVLYPILCFVCFMGLLFHDHENYNINNISLFNRFQIGLSCIYIFGVVLLCLLFYKVYKFYYILWHLIYVKKDILTGNDEKFKFFIVQHDNLQNNITDTSQVTVSGNTALVKHIQFVYFNMYTMQLTAHILRQFFGPLSNVIFEMIGLGNTNNSNSWDLVLDMVAENNLQNSAKYARLVVSKYLFDRANVSLVSGDDSNQYVGVGVETVKNVQQLQKYRSEPDLYAANGRFKNSRQRSAVKDLLGFDKYIFDIH